MKKKAFTLIELIAVLVILAILALIVTPLVMSIIKKARISADKRSVDAYGRSIELAIANYLIDTGNFPTSIEQLTIEYSGEEVVCNVMQMKENGGIYLSECTVGGKQVKDDTEDGYYHYGTRDIANEEYVDMYGLALKNASVAYYEENGNTVEDYTTLTIEYTGKPVACEVTINYDGSIYMTKCKVNNVDVVSETEEDGYYHYGTITFRSYSIGDEVSYNNVDYYVIADSDSSLANVTLLKKTLLDANEISIYSAGTGASTFGHGMVYHTNSIEYSTSYVKTTVDAWAAAQVPSGLQEARLITYEELTTDLGCTEYSCANSLYSWLYNVQYQTMSSYGSSNLWYVVSGGQLNYGYVLDNSVYVTVRPVIVLSKSVLQS